jgi:L-ornithine Nalpha-acyltransferase
MSDKSPMGAFKPVIAGNQIIRLAASRDEVEAAQRLRYSVFYEEMGAQPLPEMAATERDFDAFDDICDHLIVIDRSEANQSTVVGTYRFMRQCHAARLGRFYSTDEYDVSPLSMNGGRVMELGRSCVAPDFRSRQTMQLLWRGIAQYVSTHSIDLMFGCASFPGTDLNALAQPLSYLHHHHLAPKELRPCAIDERYESMHILKPEDVDPKQALRALPPLIKGYLRLGGYVGDGAVVDHQFNTTDVCIIVKTDLISERYSKRYEIAKERAMPNHAQGPLRKAS